MKLDHFVYHRPGSLAEASELLRSLGDAAHFIAGGTDLLPDLKRGRERACHLVSLTGIDELRAIRLDDGRLQVGALASLAEVHESPAVRRAFPALAEAAGVLGGVQIRNQGTLGGNFCRAVPCADTPPICLAGGAEVVLSDGREERVVPAAEFFTGPRQTVLAPGEVMTALVVPPQPAGSGACYRRFTLRGGLALSVASVAARVVLDGEAIREARIVLGAVAPVPLPVAACGGLLAGQCPDDDLFGRAGEIAAREAQPISDIRGSAEYRRELVAVLTRRALAEAVRRARGDGRYDWEVQR